MTVSDGTAGLGEGFLLGGKGYDEIRNISCVGERCTLFGDSNKSFGESTDFFVIAEGAEFKPIWARTFGGTHRELLHAVAPTRNGGHVLIGTSQSLFFTALKFASPSRPPRPIAMNVDTDGNLRWARTFDFLKGAFFGVTQGPDGGHVLVGFNSSGAHDSVLAAKLSSDGRLTWAYAYDLGKNAVGVGVVSTDDGSFAIAGFSASDDRQAQKMLVMKIDGLGAPLWAKSYDSDGRQRIISFAAMPDSSLVAAGWSIPPGGVGGVFVSKLSGRGAPLWSVSFEGILRTGQARDVIPGHDSDILVCGTILKGPHGANDGMAVLLGEDGTAKALTVIGGPGFDDITAAVRWKNRSYRLLGTTVNFGASVQNAFSIVWSPQLSGEESRRGLEATRLTLKETDAEIVRTELKLLVTELPLSSIETTNIAVPAGVR